MAFGKKTGGRTTGTPNKVSKNLEVFFTEHGIFIPQKLLELEPLLESPKDKVKIWLELMQYVHPKRKALETVIEIPQDRPYENLGEEELSKKLFEIMPRLISDFIRYIPNSEELIKKELDLRSKMAGTRSKAPSL